MNLEKLTVSKLKTLATNNNINVKRLKKKEIIDKLNNLYINYSKKYKTNSTELLKELYTVFPNLKLFEPFGKEIVLKEMFEYWVERYKTLKNNST